MAIGASEDLDGQDAWISQRVVRPILPRQRQDGARLGEEPHAFQRPINRQAPAPTIAQASLNIIPGPFRQPAIEAGTERTLMTWLGQGHNHDLATKIILIRNLIGRLLFRVLIVEGLNQGLSLIGRPVVHGIEIRQEPVAQAQVVLHAASIWLRIAPGFFA